MRMPEASIILVAYNGMRYLPGLVEDQGQAAARRGVFALSPNAHLVGFRL